MFVGFMESIPYVPGLVQHREAKFGGSLTEEKHLDSGSRLPKASTNMEWFSNAVRTAKNSRGRKGSDHFEDVVKRRNVE